MAWTDWLGPVRPRHFTIRTRQSVDGCRQALADAIGSRWNPFSGRAAVGYVRADRAMLRRQTLLYHNSFRPEMHVLFGTDGRGAVLRCTTRLSISTLVFMAIWVAFVLLFQIAILLAGGFQDAPPIVDFAPLGMIVTAVAITYVGALLARSEPDFLSRFVAAQVAGEVTEDDAT